MLTDLLLLACTACFLLPGPPAQCWHHPQWTDSSYIIIKGMPKRLTYRPVQNPTSQYPVVFCIPLNSPWPITCREVSPAFHCNLHIIIYLLWELYCPPMQNNFMQTFLFVFEINLLTWFPLFWLIHDLYPLFYAIPSLHSWLVLYSPHLQYTLPSFIAHVFHYHSSYILQMDFEIVGFRKAFQTPSFGLACPLTVYKRSPVTASSPIFVVICIADYGYSVNVI